MARDKNLKADLEGLLNFSNSDIAGMSWRASPNNIRWPMDPGLRKDGLTPLDYFSTIKSRADNLSSSHEQFDQLKNSMLKLQAHLRSRFDAIMGANTSPEKMMTKLFEASVVRRILIDPQADLFREEYINLEPQNDPLEQQKGYLDALLARLIFGLSLKPGWFKRCPRCEKYFVQLSLRQREFCSTRCAGAARQAKYIDKKQKKISLPRTADTAETADSQDSEEEMKERMKGGKPE